MVIYPLYRIARIGYGHLPPIQDNQNRLWSPMPEGDGP
jgi:hypothetical protein